MPHPLKFNPLTCGMFVLLM